MLEKILSLANCYSLKTIPSTRDSFGLVLLLLFFVSLFVLGLFCFALLLLIKQYEAYSFEIAQQMTGAIQV